MPNFSHTLSARITVASVLYLLLTACLLSAALHYFLTSLAHEQMDELGLALNAQLSETLKQPLINDDVISIQVILDNLLADTPVIARATVYSTSNRIVAQSQRSTGGAVLVPYIRPVNVDDNMLAQLRLELNEEQLLAEYRLPLRVALLTWLVLSALFAWYLVRTARDYTRRLEKINGAFTGERDASASELSRLELALAPFLSSDGDDGEHAAPSLRFAMLALSIPNLPKWQAQLNADHFRGMLRRIDEALDHHLAMFKGQRIHSRDGTMLLQFPDVTDEHPLARAVTCANAFLSIAGNLISAENIPFELRVTAAYRHPISGGSPWFNDLTREECIHRLLDILPLAGAWELIIDKEDIEERDDLPDCRLEDLSAAAVWQFREYSGQREEDFRRQVEFLSATVG